MKKLHDLEHEYKGNELIVSLGAGSGVTEMASKKFCLCLDISKSLTQESGTMSSNLTLFALIDFSENIEELLKKIKKKLPNKTIRVLMQHPNPSLDEKNQYNMSCLFVSLKMCLELCIILDITFVYDFSLKCNTWSKSKLLTLFIKNIDEKSVSKYSVGEKKIINRMRC